MKPNTQIKGLFLGLTTIDLQYLVAAHPAPNTKNKALQHDIAIGGPALNAAATFSKLGGETQLVSVAGNHTFTEFIHDAFRSYGLTVTDLAPEHPHLPTLASILTDQHNGDRTIVFKHGQPPSLHLNLLENLKDHRTDIILLDGFHMEAAIHLAQFGQAHSIPVVLDGGSWKAGMEDLLEYVDIAILSADFRLANGENPNWEYFKAKGVTHLAITQGERPIRFWTADQNGSIPVDSIEVVDTLGAGDVFHGAFCWFYANGQRFSESLKRASDVAGESCQFFGVREWLTG